MSRKPVFTTDMRVNEIIERAPQAVRVFGRHGIDSCCGGGLPLGEAAKRHGVAPEALLKELREAAAGAEA